MKLDKNLILKIPHWARDTAHEAVPLEADNFPGDDDEHVVQHDANLCFQAGVVEADNLRLHGWEILSHRLNWADHEPQASVRTADRDRAFRTRRNHIIIGRKQER